MSLPNPATLGVETVYRRTLWKNGQTPSNLIPGEPFAREITGEQNQKLQITNYYWPKKILLQIANRHNLQLIELTEQLATKEQVTQSKGMLDQIYTQYPFFLVMSFEKPKKEFDATE